MDFIRAFLFLQPQTTGELMACGKIKWFDNKRGFGFILQDSGEDVFIHYTCIEGDGFKALHEGDVVNYEVVESERGPKAQCVQRVTKRSL